MTLLETEPKARPRAAENASTTSRPAPPGARATAVERTSRIATIALVALVLAGGVFALFDGPIAIAWYTTRQHQLASQWAAARPHTGRGNTIAIAQVPALHLNVAIAEGDSPQQLRSGPGHRVGTPMPGDVGNSVVAGHGAAWGGPFGQLSRLKPGDLIAVQTKSSSGPVGVFTVISVRRVGGSDPAPFVGSTDRRLTLVTGTGGRFSDRRLAVTAVSGPVGKVLPPSADASATTPGGSPLWNAQVGMAALALAIAAVLVRLLRRSYRTVTIAVVVTPFFVLALLALLLDVDMLLPALRSSTRPRAALVGLLVAVFLATVFAAGAGAVTAIAQPSGNPYIVKLDAHRTPLEFTVVATGFPAGSLVYIEQCNDRPPTAPHWLPTRDCDIGSSPAAAIVDQAGTARFPAGDPNHGFQPFTGLGPEGLFACLSPSAPSLNQGVPEYRSCQIRVSSNNNDTTNDQVFLPIAFGGAPAKVPASGTRGAAGASKSSGSGSATLVVAMLAVLAVVAGAAAIVMVRRRRRARST